MTPVASAFAQGIHYLTISEQEEIERAFDRAVSWHHGQMRNSGEPYVNHPIEVARFLAGLEADSETIIAGLLHDAVEDDRVSLEVLEQEFGPVIAKLVLGVTKLSKLRYEGRRGERQVASLRKMLLTASDDLRVLLIKIADRWHNVETIGSLQEDKRQRVAAETLDIYVPFARLLGLWEIKKLFELQCFPIAFPKECSEWEEALKRIRTAVLEERESFIRDLNGKTSREVEPRLYLMTAYEAFSKLQGNVARLEEVRNVDSVHVLINRSDASPLDCYQVLGQIHLLFPVRVGFFRDYINAPQPNGYEALHTTIFLSEHHQVTLRIQTQAMHEYASKRKLSQWALQKNNDVYRALTSLHHSPEDGVRYMRDLKGVVLKERINVFTPSGEIIALPNGATGIDFAFALNPDHLPYLLNIRVNGEAREATKELHDGDTVELVLMQNEKGKLHSFWVDKVKSVEAREGLKKSLSSNPVDQRRHEGRMLIELECRKWRVPSWALFHVPHAQKRIAMELGKDSFNQILEDIGSGLLPISQFMDTYSKIIVSSPDWKTQFLSFLHLLPRTRVLDKDTKIMDIEVFAEDRQGLIHDITRCFAERKINIAKFGVFAVPPRDALYKIRMEVADFEEFSSVFDALHQVPNVKNVLRKN